MDLRGATVVVTGGRGFFGQFVATELTDAGAKVHALGSTDYDLRHRAGSARTGPSPAGSSTRTR
jgi:NAD(P)-dependent dehydrogenase (short-subunit alcohol dehydrogenase family)